jgi:hypothetical protein
LILKIAESFCEVFFPIKICLVIFLLIFLLLIEGRLLGDYTPVEDGVGLGLTLDLTSIGIGAYSLGSCSGQGILSVVLTYNVQISLLGLKNRDKFDKKILLVLLVLLVLLALLVLLVFLASLLCLKG